MLGTMQDFPLTLPFLFRHGARIHANSSVATNLGGRTVRATFGGVAVRAERLAGALSRLGIARGDRVGTFCWNHQQNLEAYFAIPCMGAVNHTLNPRLFPDQLAYIINHAGDRAIIVDDSLLPPMARVAAQLKTVEHFIVVGQDDGSLPGSLIYEDLIAAEEPGFAWPDLDERSAAAMCYTSGTTGNPKGVVYTHRSNYLHALAEGQTDNLGLSQRDRVLMIPPMFHANAWGLPYGAWLNGAAMVMPGRHLQAEPLCRLIEAERPTVTCGVPAVLAEVVRHAEAHGSDLSSLRLVLCGGAALPRALLEKYRRMGVTIVQGWGMTETSPIAAISHPPASAPERELEYIAKTGRMVAGVEMRLADGETILPWDGESIGEIEIRGPWITASYFGDDSGVRFHNGWLRTGDVGTIDSLGYVQISDRAKDVIKSGGEWISSVELEGHLMGHPDVIEAGVIGVPDERWDERPLACVVLRAGAGATPAELRDFLCSRVAKWWLPERWVFVEEIPKTSVGKFDKKVLRTRYREGELGEVRTAEN